ncbi:MAG: carbohydrate binding domain-containing protein, partial [Ruminococcus sp.]|nr:carbohydrate binding domain-containing protein [Ruminococcus sp.]
MKKKKLIAGLMSFSIAVCALVTPLGENISSKMVSANYSTASLETSSDKSDSSSVTENTVITETLWTGSEDIGDGITVDVDFSVWKTITIKATLKDGSDYAGIQLFAYDDNHEFSTIENWYQIGSKTTYSRELTNAELEKLANTKQIEVKGTNTIITKLEIIGIRKSDLDFSSDTDSSSDTDDSDSFLPDESGNLSNNELGETDFNYGKGLPWHVCESMTGKLSFDISGGTYNITIINPGGKSNDGEDRWDCQFRHRGLTIEKGHTYRITYSVKSTNEGHMYAKIGNMVDNDQELWHGNGMVLNMPTLSTTATQKEIETALRKAKTTGKKVEFGQGWDAWKNDLIPADEWVTVAYEFTADETVKGTAEYTFHFGGDGQYTPFICFPEGTELKFDNMSLIDMTDNKSNYPITEAYERNKILVNQMGYIAGLNKKATLVVDEGDDIPKPFNIISTKTGEIVYTGETTPKGADYDSGDYVQIIDFTKFNTVDSVAGLSGENIGAYYIECNDSISYSFNIGKASDSASNEVFSGILKDSLNYFYQNRSGIDIESQYISSGDKDKLSHTAGHNPDIAYIQAHWINAYNSDGSDIEKDNGTLDVTGGWYDAGDH